MSTIKVDTYLTRGGASEIAIDKLKGVTTAGSILVTGEGNSTTTNLQQGLTKAWNHYDQNTGNDIRDSFNIASITDNSTGNMTNTFTNSMNNSFYSASSLSEDGGTAGIPYIGTSGDPTNNSEMTTNLIIINIRKINNTQFDPDALCLTIHGDLA